MNAASDELAELAAAGTVVPASLPLLRLSSIQISRTAFA